MECQDKRTILLVEDEAIIAMRERVTLERLGYGVILAHSGRAAIDAFSSRDSIDLVLMDIDLGKGMDGTEAARAILEERDVPIVFLSSHAEPEVVERTESITSYGYISKNSSDTVLGASIKMAFKLFASNAEALASNKKLEATIAALPDLFFEVGADGRYLDMHCPDAALLFAPREAVIGARISDVLPKDASDIVMAAIAVAAEHGVSRGNRYRLSVPAGEKRFEASVCRIEAPHDEPRFILLCRDTTEEERIDEDLQESKRYAESLLNVSAEIILSTDLNGKITLLNDNGHRLLGYEPGELVGRDWAETCLVAEAREEVAAFLEGLMRRSEKTLVAHENLVRLKSGELRSILWHNTVLKDKDGRATGILSSGEDVSEYKELEERYRTIIDASPDSIVVTDLVGRAVMFSPKALSMFGYEDLGEHVGRRVTDFMAPEELERASANLARMARGELVGAEEYRGLKRDGSYFDIEVNGEFIRDQDGAPKRILFIVRDISSRKRQVGKYKLLFDLSPLGIALFDRETGRFLDANASMLRMLGYAREELLGLSYLDVTAPEFLDVTRESLGEIVDGSGVASYEKEYVRRDGSRLPVMVRTTSFVDDERREVLWGIIEDITERRRVEEKEARLLAEKDLILKEVHHRIKNNFSVIQSLLSLQAGASADPASAEPWRTAESRVHSMAVLYEKLYESANFLEASARDYLPALAEDIASNFADSAKVSLDVRVEDFSLDAKRLQTLGIIVNELITNSMKYAFAGRAAGSVTLSAEKAGGRIVLAVGDDGVGLGDGGPSSSGFGLSLVSMLARQLGGTMRVERAGGTRVVIEFDDAAP